jgi:hypothetical protein
MDAAKKKIFKRRQLTTKKLFSLGPLILFSLKSPYKEIKEPKNRTTGVVSAAANKR